LTEVYRLLVSPPTAEFRSPLFAPTTFTGSSIGPLLNRKSPGVRFALKPQVFFVQVLDRQLGAKVSVRKEKSESCDPEPEYSYAQIAQATNLSVTTLQRAVRDGLLVATKYSRKCVRISKSDLEAYRRRFKTVEAKA
jgi:excisionase family DNA binding protein